MKFIPVLHALKIISAGLTEDSIIKEIKDELDTVALDEPEDQPSQPVVKKRKRFLEDEEDNESVSVESQVEKYQQETCLKPLDDPFVWWRGNGDRYPKLKALARKYLCVQGSSTPAERVMSDMGNILNKKRLAMADDNFSSLMYLTDCI